jgi:hypothetical protein
VDGPLREPSARVGPVSRLAPTSCRGDADQTERRPVVLGDPDAAVAGGVGEVRLPERLLDDLAVRDRLGLREKLKDADFHGVPHFALAARR